MYLRRTAMQTRNQHSTGAQTCSWGFVLVDFCDLQFTLSGILFDIFILLLRVSLEQEIKQSINHIQIKNKNSHTQTLK